MASISTPTVVHQDLPLDAITPLERLILLSILDGDPGEGGLYVFSSEGKQDYPVIHQETLVEALAASQGFESELAGYVTGQLAEIAVAGDEFVTLDMSRLDYATILQDVLKRAPGLNYITVTETSVFSKMTREGWGATMLLITREEITGLSTADNLEDLLKAAKLTGVPAVKPGPA